MTSGMGPTLGGNVLMVYYSARGRCCLEDLLRRQGLSPHPVEGRADDAVATIERQPASVVVIDSNSRDISVSQALRQVGRMLPEGLVFAVDCDRPTANVYRGGRWMAEVGLDSIARFSGLGGHIQTG